MDVFSETRLVALSRSSYRALLFLYPASFRRAYGREMIQAFGDCCRETLRERSAWSLLRFCGLTIYDLLTTSWKEHVRMLALHVQHLLRKPAGLEALLLTAPLHLQIAQHTDIGIKRSTNEDNLVSILPDDPQTLKDKGALFVVADGMGGHSNGERASELAVNIVREKYYRQSEQMDIPLALTSAVKEANEKIYQENLLLQAQTNQKVNMGTTCIAAVLCENRLIAANVGDSRLYIVHGDQIRQISQDHSVVADMVRSGVLTKEEARHHEQRNVITRCLGIELNVEVDVFEEPVEEEDTLILCTDGLSGLVSEPEMLQIVGTYQIEECVRQLIARAIAAGGPDNITAIVVRVGSYA